MVRTYRWCQRTKKSSWAVEWIGGASRMNGILWTRGLPGDYAAWSEMGLQDWSYEKLEPYFRKIENAIAHPDSSFRGHKGNDFLVCKSALD